MPLILILIAALFIISDYNSSMSSLTNRYREGYMKICQINNKCNLSATPDELLFYLKAEKHRQFWFKRHPDEKEFKGIPSPEDAKKWSVFWNEHHHGRYANRSYRSYEDDEPPIRGTEEERNSDSSTQQQVEHEFYEQHNKKVETQQEKEHRFYTEHGGK